MASSISRIPARRYILRPCTCLRSAPLPPKVRYASSIAPQRGYKIGHLFLGLAFLGAYYATHCNTQLIDGNQVSVPLPTASIYSTILSSLGLLKSEGHYAAQFERNKQGTSGTLKNSFAKLYKMRKFCPKMRWVEIDR